VMCSFIFSQVVFTTLGMHVISIDFTMLLYFLSHPLTAGAVSSSF